MPRDRRRESALGSKPASHRGQKVAERRWDVGGGRISDLVTAGESRIWAASPSLTAATKSQNVAGTWVGDASPGGGRERKLDTTPFSDRVTAGESRLLAASPFLTAVSRSREVVGTWAGRGAHLGPRDRR